MPPFGGIPLDRLDPTLDIPSEFSRRASIFDHSLGESLEIGCRTHSVGQPASSRDFHRNECVP